MSESKMTPEQQIAECDKTLHVLRESWMEAPFEKKAKWMERINKMLDGRLIHMADRDSQKA